MKIPFNNDWKNIAISVSGGSDSALLAYLISSMANENQTLHIINHTRMWKTRPWQQYDGIRVYEYLTSHFPKLKYVLHKNFVAPELEYGDKGSVLTDEYGKKVSGDNIQQRAYAEFVCHTHNIDAYFNGVTANPKNVSFKGLVERDIESNEYNRHLEYMIHMGVEVCHPFRFLDKSDIVKKYRELNLMDLFETTRSCEGEFSHLNYENYTPRQYVPLCNTCFWCREREWAINESK